MMKSTATTAGILAVLCIPALSRSRFDCPIDFIPIAYPQYTGITLKLGYAGTGYTKTGLLTPEPIPIGLLCVDRDKVHIMCNGNCTPIGVPGVWTGAWTRTTTGSDPIGDYLDSAGSVQASITDASHVLYLPPANLNPGSSAENMVRGQILDSCGAPGFADLPADVYVKVTTTRTVAGTYDVTAVLDHIDNPPQTPPDCQQIDTICELMHQIIPDLPPFVSIDGYPTAGMILGDVRMLRSVAEDLDKIQGECGTPPGYDPPRSRFGEQLFCDRLTYSWHVLNGPGDGSFIDQGRSTIFRATVKGMVTVELIVTGTDGESAVTQRTFEIFEPRVTEMTYKDGHPLYRDNGADYGKPNWEDLNGDGDAADSGERRVSAAYTKQDKVKTQRVFIECGVKPPSYAVVRGTDPNAAEFKGAACTDPDAEDTELTFCDLEASTPLDNKIQKIDPYEIEWELNFADDFFVDAGTTDTWLYVTFADPYMIPYLPYESVYDISCTAADGQTTLSGMQDAVWHAFEDLDVRRVSRTGLNVTDGVQMGYWLTLGACQTLGEMLASPIGDGSCVAWAQLLKACLQVQGVTTAEIWELRYMPGVANKWMLIRTWCKSEPRICVGGNGVSESSATSPDVQLIPVGQGVQNAVAIRPGADGVIQTVPAGDDGLNGSAWIHTGANGICETSAHALDVQIIPLGNGEPHRGSTHPLDVAPGACTLSSTLAGDDHTVLISNLSMFLYVEYRPDNISDGQNNPDTPPEFLNHFIVRAGAFYDPSYGAGGPFGFPTPFEHEDAAISGLRTSATRGKEQIPLSQELTYYLAPGL